MVGRTIVQVSLDNISDIAGQQLLREMGVIKGSDRELQDASREYSGHALTLVLLGKYLAVRFGGDIRKRDAISRLIVNREEKGRHIQRIMWAYEIWLKDQPELEVLYLMGLFDRPADGAAIRKLRLEPVISGLTSRLQNLSDEEWDFVVSHLRDLRLLSTKEDLRPDTLDCHPLVREYFGEKLHASNAIAWRQAHGRLYEYYANLPDKHHPDTIEEMAPLYAAVAHGCLAGQYHDALHDVFIERIRRDKVDLQFVSTWCCRRRLIDTGELFCTEIHRASSRLNTLDRAYVLNEVGSAFRVLGRLDEAVVAAKSHYRIYLLSQEDQLRTARSARNLSKIYMHW